MAVLMVAVWYVSTKAYSFQGNRIVTVVVDGNRIYAELVTSKEKMGQGLGGRESICESCGMLFRFNKPGRHAFWMKDMRFPLDILWISNGKIAYIRKNVPASSDQVMMPPMDADQVLEVNAGSVDRMGLREGDDIAF